MACTTQTSDEIFAFFTQTPKHLQKQKKDTETIEEIIKVEPQPKRKELRSVVTSSHIIVKPEPRESSETKDNNVISNHYAIMYNIDKLSRRSQQAIMEILINKQIEVNGKVFTLNPNLVIICTCSDLQLIHPPLADEILLYCQAEEFQFDPNCCLDLKSLRENLKLVLLNLSNTQFVRDIVIACRHYDGIKYIPTSRVYEYIHIAAKCHALLHGFSFVKPVDIITTVTHVLAHRMHKSIEYVSEIVQELNYPQ